MCRRANAKGSNEREATGVTSAERGRAAGAGPHQGTLLPPLLGILLLSVAVYAATPVRPAVVLGRSMTPSLRSGQVVLIDRTYYRRHAVQRGDVIAFRHEGQVHVKRVIGLPGDRIWEIRNRDVPDSVFLANASQVSRVRRFLARWHMPGRVYWLRVPEGSIYVLGDGGNLSRDSRHYGPVDEDDVLGRVSLREAKVASLRRALELAEL